MKKGLIQIYTGEGKGKTTAAVGLAVRAKSRGLKVLFVQFMKNKNIGGEITLLKKLLIKTKCFEKVCSPFFNPKHNKEKIKRETNKAISFLNKTFAENKFDLVILDEFNCLIDQKLINKSDALKLISNKPNNMELVLTGRCRPKELKDIGDYITEMKPLKHPFKKGIKARKGIEF